MKSPYQQMMIVQPDMSSRIHLNTRVINFVWGQVQGVCHGRFHLAGGKEVERAILGRNNVHVLGTEYSMLQ